MNPPNENRCGNNPPPATTKPAFDPPGQGVDPGVWCGRLRAACEQRPGCTGALCYLDPRPSEDPRRAHNAAIIDRIVADKVRDAHLLRCIVQGCHAPNGGPCQYCGAVR